MKKYIKKRTIKKLVKLAAKKKNTTKRNTVVKGKRAAKIKKLEITIFGKALYRANTMIANGNSFYKKELSIEEFEREYQQFGKRTGMLKGKNLNKDLETFLSYQINKRTPKQCETAADHLKKHLNAAVIALNVAEGDTNKLSDTNKKYIEVLKETDSLKTEEKDGKEVYSIIKGKIPNKEDLLAVNDKYLSFKRIIIKYFGDKEYAEVYGS